MCEWCTVCMVSFWRFECTPFLSKRGGSCTGNHFLTTIAYYGVATNLVLYLTQVLHEGNSAAAANYSNWLGTSFLTSLIGAFLGDAYWGRYWTAIVFATINLFVSSR